MREIYNDYAWKVKIVLNIILTIPIPKVIKFNLSICAA